MKKTFYSNLVFLLFVNLLVKPFWILGIDRGVQNAGTVGAENYGLYFSLFGFSFLFQTLLDFGITNFNNRSVAQDKDFISRHMADIFSLKLMLAALYAGITLFCGWILQYDSHQVFLLSLLTVSQILSSFILYLRSNISGMHFFRIDSLISVLDKLLMIVICGFLLWGPYREIFSIEWFVYAQIAALTITLLTAFAVVFMKAAIPKIKFDFNGIKDIIRRTYPYALLGLLMAVSYRIDSVMLERMLPDDGEKQAGIYAASFRLFDAANNMLGFLFATILLPMFSRLLSEKKDVHDLAASGFKTIMLAGSFIIVPCFLYKNEIIGLLYPASDEHWSDVFGMLMPSFFGVSTVFIYGSLLTANGSMKALNIIALSGMLLNILLNYFLIPEYKAWGSATAALITQSLVGLAHIYAARTILPFEINFKPTLMFLIFCAGMVGIFIATKQVAANWMFNFLLGAAASMALAFLMRIVDIPSLLGILKSKS